MAISFLSATQIISTQDHTNITNDTEKVKTNTRWTSSRVDGHSPIGVMDVFLSINEYENGWESFWFN